MKRIALEFLIIVFIWLVVGILTAKAQDVPNVVNTAFQTSCYSELGEQTVKVHIQVSSDGVEHYQFQTNSVGTNIPASFDTHEGTYDLGWIVYTVDAQYSLYFTNDAGITAELPVVVSEIQGGECVPPADATPEPTLTPIDLDNCPYKAYNGTTGDYYCYTPTGYNLSGGVAPIPPATN